MVAERAERHGEIEPRLTEMWIMLSASSHCRTAESKSRPQCRIRPFAVDTIDDSGSRRRASSISERASGRRPIAASHKAKRWCAPELLRLSSMARRKCRSASSQSQSNRNFTNPSAAWPCASVGLIRPHASLPLAPRPRRSARRRRRRRRPRRVAVSQCRPGAGMRRVGSNPHLVEQRDRAPQGRFVTLIEIENGTEILFVPFGIHSVGFGKAAKLIGRQVDADFRRHGPGDVGLESENIGAFPIVDPGPCGLLRFGIDEGQADADPLLSVEHGTFQQDVDVETPGHLLRRQGRALETHHRRSRCHAHRGNLGQRADQGIGHRVGVISNVGIRRQIRQWQHRQRSNRPAPFRPTLHLLETPECLAAIETPACRLLAQAHANEMNQCRWQRRVQWRGLRCKNS